MLNDDSVLESLTCTDETKHETSSNALALTHYNCKKIPTFFGAIHFLMLSKAWSADFLITPICPTKSRNKIRKNYYSVLMTEAKKSDLSKDTQMNKKPPNLSIVEQTNLYIKFIST